MVVKQEDKKLIRGLQRLLKRSITAKLLAVRRVTSNRGIKTSGVDRVKLNTPKSKWQETTTWNTNTKRQMRTSAGTKRT